MKRIALLALLFACQPPEAPDTSEQDKANVEAVSKQYGEAIIAGDLETLRNLGGEGTLMPPAEAAIQGPENITAFFQDGPDVEGSISPQDFHVSGDLGVVRGNYNLTFTVSDSVEMQDKGKYLEVWSRQEDGSWKLQYDIWNSDIAPEEDENMEIEIEEEG